MHRYSRLRLHPKLETVQAPPLAVLRRAGRFACGTWFRSLVCALALLNPLVAAQIAVVATPAPVTGTTTTLSLDERDAVPGAMYQWTVLSTPAGGVAALATPNERTTIATFTQAGRYRIACERTANGQRKRASVQLQVEHTLVALSVSPNSVAVSPRGQTTFSAVGIDQFNAAYGQMPVTWSVNGGGKITKQGVFTADTIAGTWVVTATSGAFSATAQVRVGTAITSPTVAMAATATPNVITGDRTQLSVRGDDDGGEAALLYTWSATGPEPVTFSAHGTNAAKACTAIVSAAGNYLVVATISDAQGNSVTSSTSMTVNQTLTGLTIIPFASIIPRQGSQACEVSSLDQFGDDMASPTVTWSVSGVGTITANGLFQAEDDLGVATVTATAGALNATATVSVINTAPTIDLPMAALGVDGTTVELTTRAHDDRPESTLTYRWTTPGAPPAPVSFSTQDTNSAKLTTATFAHAGSYTFDVTATDADGQSTTSVPITVIIEPVYVMTVHPAMASLAIDRTQAFTALIVDQFTANPEPPPLIVWSVSGVGTIDDAGLFTAGQVTGLATVTATAGLLRASAAFQVFDPNPPPTIVTAAAADPNPTTTTMTTLHVSADDVAGEANLTYTWSTLSGPATVPFDTNGEHQSSTCVATFSAIGTYVFAVDVRNPGGRTTASHVTVEVLATHTLHIHPEHASVVPNATHTFSASLRDQFTANTPVAPVWSIEPGAGTIDQSGRFLAGPTLTGPVQLTATYGALVATAQVRVARDQPIAHHTQVSTSRGHAVTCVLSASDSNQDPLTYTIVEPPQHGTLSGSPPTLLYTPTADYIGQDTFTFRANDGASDSNLGTITVQIYDQLPPSTPAALGILSLPAACDLNRWQHDADYRAAYLTSIEPGRVWQSASGATGIPHLMTPGQLWLSAPGMSLVTLQVQGAADAPVSFTCTGEGHFTANRRNAITVASDANGLASVVFRTPSAGSSPILVASPAAVGRVRFMVEVRP